MYAHTLLKPDGSQEALEKKMSWEEVQKIVGGYIQVVAMKDNKRCLLVNEDGLIIGLPANDAATALVHPAVLCRGIVGNAVVIQRKSLR